MDFINEHILPHWPAVMAYFGFVLSGQFAKAQVWTKKKAATSKPIHFMRRTLAVHAPIVGLAVGAIPGIPVSPGVEGIAAAMIYWGGIGMFASFSFHAVSAFVKNKWGVDLKAAVEDAVRPSMGDEKTPKP